jgi:hypothetical protein
MGNEETKTLTNDMDKGFFKDILDDTDFFVFGEVLKDIVRMPLFISEANTDYLMVMPNETVH